MSNPNIRDIASNIDALSLGVLGACIRFDSSPEGAPYQTLTQIADYSTITGLECEGLIEPYDSECLSWSITALGREVVEQVEDDDRACEEMERERADAQGCLPGARY